ncbi:MAG: hypothetical protein GY882_01710 [Actinomycetia bacterium]|nr:hypothetical protein [Actinomycetes bacterium]MCP4844887.1 hypothetical protein [Actinomycetes bacterium]
MKRRAPLNDPASAGNHIEHFDVVQWRDLLDAGALSRLSEDEVAYLIGRMEATVRNHQRLENAAKQRIADLERQNLSERGRRPNLSPTAAAAFMTDAQKREMFAQFARTELANLEKRRSHLENRARNVNRSVNEVRLRLGRLVDDPSMSEAARSELESLRRSLKDSLNEVHAVNEPASDMTTDDAGAVADASGSGSALGDLFGNQS